ncbi:polysaccharide pyruvyl transferase family protein [Methyloligella sp. 2.7D]|uniref:polysaccharide pyruvyl transferase family protein n=1 Tax=unclassified Methyloligella TaxID=2625955 RepID=UPI00157C361F|nr:polysaccharide pyruvyl transferase family protein [Methyloligella sp. GL2]QKP78201.1 polysaccharide pyruvyl transferase family protein [Methyloligella sp. GL2]
MVHNVAIASMTGARNRGCEALVRSIIDGIHTVIGRDAAKISLHSADAKYDRKIFGDDVAATYDAHPLSWPSPLRLKALQGPQIRMARLAEKTLLPSEKPGAISRRSLTALSDADIIVATGGDVFTGDYGPSNFRSHCHILHLGKPVFFMAQTMGPFAPAEEAYLRKHAGAIAMCTVRESDSLEYLQKIAPEIPVHQAADVAFLLPSIDADAARRILEVEHHFPIEGKKLVGVSVSAGIVGYRGAEGKVDYIGETAKFVNELNANGYAAILIPHVQNIAIEANDLFACTEVLRQLEHPERNLVLSLPLSASEFKGIVALCDVLVGARTHATIAALSQGVPAVAIGYSRKSFAIFRDYYGEDISKDLAIDVVDMTADKIGAAFAIAQDMPRTTDRAAEMKQRALTSFERLKTILEAA